MGCIERETQVAVGRSVPVVLTVLGKWGARGWRCNAGTEIGGWFCKVFCCCGVEVAGESVRLSHTNPAQKTSHTSHDVEQCRCEGNSDNADIDNSHVLILL